MKYSMTVGFKADLYNGEGGLTGSNRTKLDQVAMDHGGITGMDIIGDWIRELQYYYDLAEGVFFAEMMKSGPDQVTFDAVLGLMSRDESLLDPADSLTFQWLCDKAGLDPDDAHDWHWAWYKKNLGGNVVTLRPCQPSDGSTA